MTTQTENAETQATAANSPPQLWGRVVGMSQIQPDRRNARRRTERSSALIESSLSEFGAARSIVIDETGTVLAGNGTVEAAASLGIDRVLVVPTDGNTLVAVQRTDLSDRQKRRYAIADNRASDLSEWDAQTLSELSQEDPDLRLDSFFTDEELDHLMADLAPEEGGEEEKTGSQGKLEVKLTFEDPSDFDTFLQTLQQLSAALPKLRTTEQRIQYVLDQFLSD
jgi:hypothetical protein